jgi:hypothetical protein
MQSLRLFFDKNRCFDTIISTQGWSSIASLCQTKSSTKSPSLWSFHDMNRCSHFDAFGIHHVADLMWRGCWNQILDLVPFLLLWMLICLQPCSSSLTVLLLLGSPPGACPSTPGQGLLHLATFFSFQGLIPCFAVSNGVLVLCKRTVVFFQSCGAGWLVLPPLVVLISFSCWLSWAAVVLPAALSQSSDCAACVLLAYVCHCFDLIHFLDVLWNLVWYPSALYPSF